MARARLRFTCAGASCDGVYPLRYQVTINGLAITTWSLLALKATTVEHPLRVVLARDPDAYLCSSAAGTLDRGLARDRHVRLAPRSR